jgi:hypothetical protein
VAYTLRPELLLNIQLSLVETTKFVDLVLVLATDLDIVTCGDLVLLGKL